MSTFGAAPTTTPRISAMDPTRHVNYELGMVLGVDDFTQEFAYHSERDRWLARELLGYGTVWGLAVTKGSGSRGPELRVSAGVAVSPRGQLLRVASAQAASLNDWLAARTQQVAEHLSGDKLKLYVVLGYEPRLTDRVPIPGEPCRSENDAMKPSRVADGFKLELSFEPPRQDEEDALRDLVRWLREHLQVSPQTDPSFNLKTGLERFVITLRNAVVRTSPPSRPTDFLRDTFPATPVVVPAEHLGTYLREALRIWVTELRPLWRTDWLAEANSSVEPTAPQGEDLVLLAELEPRLKREGNGTWTLLDASTLLIEEGRRPFLAHLRLLQEWLLRGLRPDTPPPPGVSVVAAGTVPTNTNLPTFNGLDIVDTVDGAVTLTFNGYQEPTGQPFQYVVKALLQPAEELKAPVVTFGGFQPNGFVLHVRDSQGAPIPKTLITKLLRFIVEVSRYQHG